MNSSGVDFDSSAHIELHDFDENEFMQVMVVYAAPAAIAIIVTIHIHIH